MIIDHKDLGEEYYFNNLLVTKYNYPEGREYNSSGISTSFFKSV